MLSNILNKLTLKIKNFDLVINYFLYLKIILLLFLYQLLL